MEFISETHKAVIDDEGLLRVWQLKEKELRITRSTPDGGLDVSIVTEMTAPPAEKRALEHANRVPLFVAGYAGKSEWELDIDCGFQRWHGTKTSKELSKALSNCSFEDKVRKEILATCRKHKPDYVPRYY